MKRFSFNFEEGAQQTFIPSKVASCSKTRVLEAMKSLINPPELFPNLEKSAGASQTIVHCQVVICGHRLGFHRVERSLSSPAVVSDHARAVQFTTKPSGRE